MTSADNRLKSIDQIRKHWRGILAASYAFVWAWYFIIEFLWTAEVIHGYYPHTFSAFIYQFPATLFIPFEWPILPQGNAWLELPFILACFMTPLFITLFSHPKYSPKVHRAIAFLTIPFLGFISVNFWYNVVLSRKYYDFISDTRLFDAYLTDILLTTAGIAGGFLLFSIFRARHK